jgi:soluble lytic murein transglycosylase-like protein
MIISAKLPVFGASLAIAVMALSPVQAASRTAKRVSATASQDDAGASEQRSAVQKRAAGAVVPEKYAKSSEQKASEQKASEQPKSLAEALFGAGREGKPADQAALKSRRIKSGIIAVSEKGETRSAAVKPTIVTTTLVETASIGPETTPVAVIEKAADASAPAGSVRALIAQHAARNGIPPALADAVVRVESRYNAAARNGVNLGLTQISFATARSLGYAGGAAGLLDADTNLRYGMLYLAQAYRLSGGDTCRTVLKYQAGHRATSMTGAARAYCAKVKTTVATAN